MYLPAHFEETRSEVLHEFIRAHPLGSLVTVSSGGLDANHIPFEIDRAPAPHGTLRAHVARANPLWRSAPSAEVLVIFQASGSYVSPAWYPSRRESGQVVPTWNYAVVHAHGSVRFIEDRAWLRALVGRLTERHEAGREDQWHVSDAPADFIDQQLNAIVGVEIAITRIVGKWKVSQNRLPRDRVGAADGLSLEGNDAAAEMAALVRKYNQQ